MNLLLYGEIRPENTLPAFGSAFRAHMESKRYPSVYAASLSAWSLLAEGLLRLGLEKLPEVRFTDSGKPVFANHPLYFSLSHSGNLAAALISDAPCGVDIERIRPETAERLRDRVLSADEKLRNCDFFEIWAKKEAIGKLLGTGMPVKPCEMDISLFDGFNHLSQTIKDSLGSQYALFAVSEDPSPMKKPDRP